MDNDWQDRQRRRWMRPNAHLYIRPDAARWLQPNQQLWQKPTYDEQKYSPGQPRVPAGNSDGGQWTAVSSGGGISIAVPAFGGFDGGDGGDGTDLGTDTGVDGAITLPEIVVTADDGAADGFNDEKPIRLAGEIPTGDPPEIPKERPPTTQLRNIIVRALARRLGPSIWMFVEAGSWIYDHKAEINSFFDSPKSLEELQDAAKGPEKGYDIHHIVERSSAAKDGSEADLINAPENLVRIPRWKHWLINAWYQIPNKDFGLLTPREYLQGKSWDERTRVGLMAMRDVGVLRP
jgi:hypothetical protein